MKVDRSKLKKTPTEAVSIHSVCFPVLFQYKFSPVSVIKRWSSSCAYSEISFKNEQSYCKISLAG